jgi:hypothetical protein
VGPLVNVALVPFLAVAAFTYAHGSNTAVSDFGVFVREVNVTNNRKH